LAPAIALILSPAAEAAKKETAKPAAAKKKAAPSDSKKARKTDKTGVASPSAASQTWEAPPKDDITKTPLPPPPPETKPAPEPAAAPVAAPAAAPAPAPAAAPPAESPAAPSEPPPPPPPEEETMPALIPPPPTQYVEHLGPSAYPGNGPYGGWTWWPGVVYWGPGASSAMMRGLYGGSLWLEPTFNGLQWPYMTRTGVGVSGSAWVDTGYEKIDREYATAVNSTRWQQQARALLRVTPTYVSGRFFVQAQAELVANGCQSTGSVTCDMAGQGTVDTDDLWLRVGHWNVWDVKVGRFEGWELYHTGMGLDINTLERLGPRQEGQPGARIGDTVIEPPDYYGVNFMHDRPRGLGLGYLALHLYPMSILRFEMLGEIGTTSLGTGASNYLGGRPSAIFDLGWLKLKAGAEYQSKTAQNQQFVTDPNTGVQSKGTDNTGTTNKGLGAAVQFVFDPYVELGANIAYGESTSRNKDGNVLDTGSYTKTSVGGFANAHLGRRGSVLEDLMLGGGANWTTQYYSHRVGTNNQDYFAHLQVFGAIQYLVAKQLFVKVVLAYARADFWPSGEPDSISNTMLSGRLRLMYLY
jgi:hypothetical protein